MLKPYEALNEKIKEKLALFRALDEDLLPSDFDPQAIVGDLKECIDAAQIIKNEWNALADFYESEYVNGWAKKVSRLRRRSQKLLQAIKETMLKENVEKIPGINCRAQLMKSPKRIEISIEADEAAQMEYPEFVKMDIAYQWDKKEILAHIEAGEIFPFATVSQGKYLQFYPLGDE